MRLTPPPITTQEVELRAWLRRFSTERPRWGWRRAAKMARRAGWQVNNKRIRRLWREEGLRVPQRRKKKRLTGIGVAVGAMSPIRPNVIWAMDFQFDTTAEGRTLKMLNVIDEFTREALAIKVDRAIDADGVVDILDRLALKGGAPHYVRFDNGPEFVAHAVNDWCRFNGAGSLFIDPGSPWQNAWIWVLYLDCRRGRCFPGGCSKRPALTLLGYDAARTVLDSKCRAGRRGAGLGCWLKESMHDSIQICRRRTL